MPNDTIDRNDDIEEEFKVLESDNDDDDNDANQININQQTVELEGQSESEMSNGSYAGSALSKLTGKSLSKT